MALTESREITEGSWLLHQRREPGKPRTCEGVSTAREQGHCTAVTERGGTQKHRPEPRGCRNAASLEEGLGEVCAS